MKAENFSLDGYFERIGFSGSVNQDLNTLEMMMRAQLCSVAFENTEVQAGRIPSLKPEDIVKKIVYDGRGGYCYELNGLFAMALETIGFEYYFAAARPMTYPERRPKTHMVVIVRHTIFTQKKIGYHPDGKWEKTTCRRETKNNRGRSHNGRDRRL